MAIVTDLAQVSGDQDLAGALDLRLHSLGGPASFRSPYAISKFGFLRDTPAPPPESVDSESISL